MSSHQILKGRMFSIPWFANCGKGDSANGLPFDAQQVASWKDAMAICETADWENTTLEGRNELTELLHKNHVERYRSWNTLTGELKTEIIGPLTEEIWKPYARNHNLPKVFLDCVQWDVLAACTEEQYADCTNGVWFPRKLFTVYVAGGFPCGWQGGEYPRGGLLYL